MSEKRLTRYLELQAGVDAARLKLVSAQRDLRQAQSELDGEVKALIRAAIKIGQPITRRPGNAYNFNIRSYNLWKRDDQWYWRVVTSWHCPADNAENEDVLTLPFDLICESPSEIRRVIQASHDEHKERKRLQRIGEQERASAKMAMAISESAAPTNNYLDKGEVRLWAILRADNRYSGFFPFRSCVWAGGDEPVLVRLIPDDEGPYWGWVGLTGLHKNRVSMVQPSKLSFEVQSPDFFKRSIMEGNGRIQRFRVEPVEVS